MVQWLYVVGSIPLIALGLLHLVFTAKDIAEPRFLAPKSQKALAEMQTEELRLTSETTVWRAWLGFNVTHSLAVLMTGVTTVYLSLNYWTIMESDVVIAWAAPFLAWVFVMLAKQFWFSRPFSGALVSATLLTAAALANAL